MILLMLLFMIGGSIFLNLQPQASLYISGFAMLMTLLTTLWALSLIVKDSGIIDIFWGFGFVAMVWWYFYKTGQSFDNTRAVLFAVLVSVWGIRLTTHLAIRNIGKPEDYRYQEFRAQGGKNYWWISFFRVFLLQGIILWNLSAFYLLVLQSDATTLLPLDYVGMGLWTIGFFFEAVGDWQLAQFKKNPANKGKVLDTGLWKYTRHPNYFGDACLWWGFFIFALAHPQGIWYSYAPIFMTFLLVKVSGVAMLETALKKNKPQYAEYIKNTPAFVPFVKF